MSNGKIDERHVTFVIVLVIATIDLQLNATLNTVPSIIASTFPLPLAIDTALTMVVASAKETGRHVLLRPTSSLLK